MSQVTVEMIAEGVRAYEDPANLTDIEVFGAIYRAMATVAPLDHDRTMMELARAERDIAQRRIAALESENAALMAENKRLADGPPTQHPPEYVAKVLMDREGRCNDPFAHARLTEVIRCARLDGRKQARDVALAVVAAKDARIAELKSELAAFTIANVSPVQDTETPKPNPFRDFPTDPRRMG